MKSAEPCSADFFCACKCSDFAYANVQRVKVVGKLWMLFDAEFLAGGIKKPHPKDTCKTKHLCAPLFFFYAARASHQVCKILLRLIPFPSAMILESASQSSSSGRFQRRGHLGFRPTFYRREKKQARWRRLVAIRRVRRQFRLQPPSHHFDGRRPGSPA